MSTERGFGMDESSFERCIDKVGERTKCPFKFAISILLISHGTMGSGDAIRKVQELEKQYEAESSEMTKRYGDLLADIVKGAGK